VDHVPKVILLDASNRIHPTDFCSRTDQFDSDVSADLNYRVFVVGELRRSSVRVKLDVGRNELILVSASSPMLGRDTHM